MSDPGFQLELKLRIVVTECRGTSFPITDEVAGLDSADGGGAVALPPERGPPAEEQFLVGGREDEEDVSMDRRTAMSTEMREADLRSFLTSLRAPVSAHSRSTTPPAMSATARLVPRCGDSSGLVVEVGGGGGGRVGRPWLLSGGRLEDVVGRGYRVSGGSPVGEGLVEE